MTTTSHREWIRRWSAPAQQGSAGDQRLPGPGDVFVLAETKAFYVEWLIVEADPEDTDRFVAVAADTHPSTGTADVEVPAEAPAGPLSLRCGIEVRLDAGALDPALRTGSVGSGVLSEVRRKRSEMAEGRLTGSVLAHETDHETGYLDRLEVLSQARAALESRKRRPARDVAPVRAIFHSGRPIGRVYALAASLLLLVTLAGLIWQRQTIDRLRQDQDEPLVNLPVFLLLKEEVVRGETVATIPAQARFVGLVLALDLTTAAASYRMEVRSKETGALVWSGAGLRPNDLAEVSLALPRRLLAPGGYRLSLYGPDGGPSGPATTYLLRVEVE